MNDFPKKFKISIYIEDLDMDYYLKSHTDSALIWAVNEKHNAEFHSASVVDAVLEYPQRTIYKDDKTFIGAFPVLSRYHLRITPYRMEMIEEVANTYTRNDIKNLATKKKLNKFFDTLKPEELAVAKELIKELK